MQLKIVSFNFSWVQIMSDFQPLSNQGQQTTAEEAAQLIESVAYVTREFVRRDCRINGAVFSDVDCDVVIAEVQKLAIEGKFKHCGVYWIANALAGEGKIHPVLPQRQD